LWAPGSFLYWDRFFACGHCHPLAYVSAWEQAPAPAVRRDDRLRARPGWDLGLLNDPDGKPKGMRWRTFARVVAQHDALAYRRWRESGIGSASWMSNGSTSNGGCDERLIASETLRQESTRSNVALRCSVCPPAGQ
jgi:hypothetical protein